MVMLQVLFLEKILKVMIIGYAEEFTNLMKMLLAMRILRMNFIVLMILYRMERFFL